MLLCEAIAAAGMTPPPAHRVVPGKWIRFPGVGKGRSNSAGWCRLLDEHTAVFGDWASGFHQLWRAEGAAPINRHEARRIAKVALDADRRRAELAARAAQSMVGQSRLGTHPYLTAKGFPLEQGLICGELLVVPARAVEDYQRIVTVQTIDKDGTKLFLKDGRAKGAIHKLGAHAANVALCEGYATGLTLREAFALLGRWQVIVCFSAGNLREIARGYPKAIVCADNDVSGTGELAARQTGLKWVMPPKVGDDFNDVMVRQGLREVVDVLRSALHS